MTLMGFLAILALGFGGGYKLKTDQCVKKGCPKIEKAATTEEVVK